MSATSNLLVVSADTATVAAALNPGDCLGNYSIFTPSIDELANAIVRWIELDLPGGAAYGPQRCGKTWALDYIAATAADYFSSKFFIVRLVMPEGLTDRLNDLAAEWLIQQGLIANARDPVRLRQRLINWFKEMLESHGAERLLLFVDEAQNLSRAHHGQLIYLFNILEKERMRPFVLLMGQPELAAMVPSFVTMQEMQLMGRFYERLVEFKGIAAQDVGTVLKGFEQPVIADGEEQACGLAQLFPHHWHQGWRIAGWAPGIVAALNQLAERRSLPNTPRLPMMHLRSVIIGGLKEMQRTGKRLDQISERLVLTLLQQSGFAQYIAAYARLDRKSVV